MTRAATDVRLIRTVNGEGRPCGWWPASKRADLEQWIKERRGQHKPYRIEVRTTEQPDEYRIKPEGKA